MISELRRGRRRRRQFGTLLFIPFVLSSFSWHACACVRLVQLQTTLRTSELLFCRKFHLLVFRDRMQIVCREQQQQQFGNLVASSPEWSNSQWLLSNKHPACSSYFRRVMVYFFSFLRLAPLRVLESESSMANWRRIQKTGTFFAQHYSKNICMQTVLIASKTLEGVFICNK